MSDEERPGPRITPLPGLQHERTGLAWERTAIAMMVSGIALARFTEQLSWPPLASLGLIQAAVGSAVLIWSAHRGEDRLGPDDVRSDVVHPRAAGLAGGFSVAFCAIALAIAISVVVS